MSHDLSAEDQDPRAASLIQYLRRRIDASGLAPRTVAAFWRVPREHFVPEYLRDYAYADEPQPIGYGQTISQPSLVAQMTDLLALSPTDRVLEIGTGSGYQTAILAELAGEVFSIEIVAPLAQQAERLLQQAGYRNVHVQVGDGHHGWPSAAPFDAILVAASAEDVPPALIEQLAPSGRLVIPVRDGLWLYRKDAAGGVHSAFVEYVRFVPLVKSRAPR
ncbi:MAG TPA: protein-L-isoaspartate(D-aspartate) O-methyltransferase [Polyangiaceae bacterium]|jgi:protein-L-isoaspartate(D-aspartate) O-methyltransferase|nr:protein-L-isoaspartate(D-aspartate) O-methyltransferase [Polyangiaceae bacterium]